MRNGRKSASRLWLILALLLLIISAGCAATSPMPPKPVKPILTVEQRAGGICLDDENTMLLLDYIWRLEEGYR